MANNKQQLLVRLKTIAGHVRGIARMVEADAYCIDLIKQTQAIQRALDKWNSLVLEAHLNSCVTTALRGDQVDERERVVTELMELFQFHGDGSQEADALPRADSRTQQRVAALEAIEARVRHVQQMIEADAYCVDLIRETKSIQRALDSFNSTVLADHLGGCVTTAIRGEQPEERERVVSELLQVFDTTSNL